MKKNKMFIFVFLAVTSKAYTDCTIVDGDKKMPFDGKDLRGLVIEKKSLIELNKEFPDLNIIEKVFKGELLTCTGCTEKYITCSN